MAWGGTRTWVTGEVVTATIGNAQWRDNIDAIAAVGDYKFKLKAGTVVETVIDGGWLECNGVVVSRATYSALNTLLSSLGYPFGNGDGSTTFHLPDARGRHFAVAGGAGGHSDMVLGGNEGVGLGARRQRHNSSRNGAVTRTGAVTKSGTIGPGGGNALVAGGGFGSGSSGWTVTPLSDGITINDGIGINDAISIGPQTGAEPLDAGAYLVAGVVAIKF